MGMIPSFSDMDEYFTNPSEAGRIELDRLFRTEAEAQTEIHELNKELLELADD